MCRDESKDLQLFLGERRFAQIYSTHPSRPPRQMRKGRGGKKAIHTAPIAPHERERCRIIPMRLDRCLLRRWRCENLASAHGYRFRFRLRSLLRFFSAFIFASHAASMTQTPAPEKSRKGFPVLAVPPSTCRAIQRRVLRGCPRSLAFGDRGSGLSFTRDGR